MNPILHAAQLPWTLLAALAPALAGLGGLAMPTRRSLWSLGGLVGLWLCVARIVLGFDVRLDGYQFAVALPGAALGVDGWSAAGLVVLAGITTLAASMRWDRSVGLPPLLLASSAAVLALTALDPTTVLISAVGGVLLLGGGRPAELVLAAAALAGLTAASSDPLLSWPLLVLGFGGLALWVPRGDAGAMVLRAGALSPALLLAFPRQLMPLVADGALVWTQATAPLAAAVAVWGALRALGARDLPSMATANATHQGAVVLTAWHAVRLDAWNGAVLTALWIGPVVGLLLSASDDPEARWARERGQPRRALAAGLAGLSVAGLPLTPGFAGLLLISLGSWQSQWRHAPWWLIVLAIATWIGAFAPLRAAAALRRGEDAGAPLPRRAAVLLLATLALGLAPRLLLDLIDSGSVDRIAELSAPLERLVTGQLRPLLPEALQGWWL
jgi:hypothetical protein